MNDIHVLLRSFIASRFIIRLLLLSGGLFPYVFFGINFEVVAQLLAVDGNLIVPLDERFFFTCDRVCELQVMLTNKVYRLAMVLLAIVVLHQYIGDNYKVGSPLRLVIIVLLFTYLGLRGSFIVLSGDTTVLSTLQLFTALGLIDVAECMPPKKAPGNSGDKPPEFSGVGFVINLVVTILGFWVLIDERFDACVHHVRDCKDDSCQHGCHERMPKPKS